MFNLGYNQGQRIIGRKAYKLAHPSQEPFLTQSVSVISCVHANLHCLLFYMLSFIKLDKTRVADLHIIPIEADCFL